MTDEKTNDEPAGASGGSLANAHSDRQDAEAKIIVDGIAEIMRIASEPDWIPVTERLPEEGEVVLAYLPKQIDVESGVYAAMLSKLQTLKGTFSTSFGFGFEATHWMPLPAPPTDAK